MASVDPKFSQMLNRLQQKAVITLSLKLEVHNYQSVRAALVKLVNALDSGLTDLALEGAEIIQRRTIERMQSHRPGPIMSKSGKESYKVFEDLPLIQHIISVPPAVVHQGKAGFAKKSSLDKVKINEKTTSPYVHSWQIAEFGTGRLASPRKRTRGAFKVPGGGGSWYINKKTRSPVMIGSEGGHFLFGFRAEGEFIRGEIQELTNFYRARIQNIFYREFLNG